MTPLDFALAYSARGWRVAPIPPGRKHPSIKQWQNAATTDEARIRRYYGQNPTHGVCIATGAESGLFAVDIDPDDGGDDSLRALEARYGPLPDKLLRSVGDALTVGGLIVDDARFVAVEAVKVEVTGWTGAIIRITREDGAVQPGQGAQARRRRHGVRPVWRAA